MKKRELYEIGKSLVNEFQQHTIDIDVANIFFTVYISEHSYNDIKNNFPKTKSGIRAIGANGEFGLKPSWTIMLDLFHGGRKESIGNDAFISINENNKVKVDINPFDELMTNIFLFLQKNGLEVIKLQVLIRTKSLEAFNVLKNHCKIEDNLIDGIKFVTQNYYLRITTW